MLADTLLAFTPVIGFLLIMTLYTSFAKKLNYSVMATLVIIGGLANIGLEIFVIGTVWLIPVLQVGLAGLIFVGLIYLGGKKTSADTIMTLTGTFATIPLWSGIWTIFFGLLFLTGFLVANVVKKMGGKDAIQQLATEAVISGSNTMNAAPGLVFENLPDRQEVETNAKRISTAPFFWVGALVNLLIVLAIRLL